MAARGQKTTEKSKPAEKKLVTAVKKVKETLEDRGHKVEHVFNLSYYDMKQNSHIHLGTPAPNEDDKMTICPDGGALLVDGKIAGIFEDKYEGTADDVGKEDAKWAGEVPSIAHSRMSTRVRCTVPVPGYFHTWSLLTAAISIQN
jgi:hypothetical protein